MVAADPVPEALGEFAVEHELGRGGSGVVYAARWGAREVALKVLRADEAATAKERERFLQEARHLARVDHPGVVRVVAVGELPDGRPYLAMERLRGTTLADRLVMRPLSLDQALVLFEQLAAAVAALHAAGLVHRDIKPENIMLVDDARRLVLLDFGIARGVDDLPSTTTQAGLQRGTPAYMAPERFFGARATVSSDVYETAVVLYVMLTGALPWADPRSPRDRLEPRPPSALGVSVGASLEAALMAALVPDPARRPASIDELVASVRAAGWSGETEVAPARGPESPSGARGGGTTQRVRGRGAVVAIGMVMAFAAAVGVAVVVAGGSRARRAEPAAATAAAPAPVAAADAGAATQPAAEADAATATAPAAAAAAVPATKPVAKPSRKTKAKPAPPPPSRRTSPPATASGGATASLAECERIRDLYCTDEFKASEGNLAGALCKSFGEQVDDWARLPDPARDAQADWCRTAYPQMAAAVEERLRQFREYGGPPARP